MTDLVPEGGPATDDPRGTARSRTAPRSHRSPEANGAGAGVTDWVPATTDEAQTDQAPTDQAPTDQASTDQASTDGASTDDSEPEDYEGWPEPTPEPGTEVSDRWRYAVPAFIVFVVGVICLLNHFHGVDWGDDFALYMRQAKALNIGNIGEVIRDNRFSVDNSGWHTFSPYVYPWGWPLLVAPVYAAFGLNYEAIKVLEVVALCGFLFFFFDLVRRRAGTAAAVLLALLIGLSPSYVGGTDTVLSDLPYLGIVGFTLWWIDRCRRGGILDTSRRRLVIVGLLVAFAFNIRREGFILLIPLAAIQLHALAATTRGVGLRRRFRDVQWKQLVAPYATFAVAIAAFQVLLPSTLIPEIVGAGPKNARPNLGFYRNILAENVGLKGPGYPMAVFHSHLLAERLLVLLVTLAAVGLIGRLVRNFEEDILLAVFVVMATLVVLNSPYQEGRYLVTVAPFVVYFAYQAIPTLAGFAGLSDRTLSRRLVAVVPLVALAGLVNLNFVATRHSTDYHHQYHLTVNGPALPASRQMFDAVESLTRGNDVILFFRARAMTLYTNRQAVQGSNLDQMLPRVDWYVMEKGSTYSQALVTDSQASTLGLSKAWENSEWIIWRTLPRSH